jgi:superfamily II DNA or RNA helicase
MEQSKKYKTYINTKGYVIRKSAFPLHQIEDAKSELTVMPIVCAGYQTEEPEPFKVYRENETKLYVPRQYGIKKFGAPDNNIYESEEYINNQKLYIPDHNCFTKIKLRPIQEPIIAKYNEAILKYGGGTISAACGVGKTAMGIYMISTLKMRTIILVHKEFLMNQWITRIQEFMPNASIGKIQGKKCDVLGRDIVVGMVQSVSKKDDYPAYAFSDFGFLIVDEAHHMSSRCFSKALPKTSFQYTLSLTATPKRKDGLENVFLWYLGDIVFKSEKVQSADVIVKIYEYNNNRASYCKEFLNYQKKPNHAKMISNIAESNERNYFIGKLLPKLIKEGRRILILTERLSQVKWFIDALKDRFVVDGKSIGIGKYVGGMKQTLLDLALEAEIVVGTYSMISEGFDCPSLDTLIMASPKTDIEQSVGRILRKQAKDRTVSPLIVDMWDVFSTYRNKGFQRLRYYKQHGYTIKKYMVVHNKDMNDFTCEKMDKSKKLSINRMEETLSNCYGNKNSKGNNKEEHKHSNKHIIYKFDDEV